MRAASASTTPERTFLHECFSVPVVRDRLERGVKLQELNELKTFLERNREKQFLQKEYGYLIQDLEFLELEGALKMPAIVPGRYMTVRNHWVALKGYFDPNEFDLANEGLRRRFIINTPSVLSPVLALDGEAWTIYNLIVSYRPRLTRYQVMAYLVYILEVLMMTESPLGYIVNESYIHHVMNTYTPDQCLAESPSSFNRLSEAEKLDDPRNVVLRILQETYCLPSNNWIFSDGFYFLMTLPSWTLSASDNYVENWDFFTCEV